MAGQSGQGRALLFARYGLPALLVLAGIVSLFVVRGEKLEISLGLVAAAVAVLSLNVFYRIGLAGDTERDSEEASRDYYEEHGEWPPEAARPEGRQWTLPEGIATPESTAADRSRERSDG